MRLDPQPGERRPAYQGRLVVDMGSNMTGLFKESGIVKSASRMALPGVVRCL